MIIDLLCLCKLYHFQIFYQLAMVLVEVVIWKKCRVLTVLILSLLFQEISKNYDIGIFI